MMVDVQSASSAEASSAVSITEMLPWFLAIIVYPESGKEQLLMMTSELEKVIFTMPEGNGLKVQFFNVPFDETAYNQCSQPENETFSIARVLPVEYRPQGESRKTVSFMVAEHPSRVRPLPG